MRGKGYESFGVPGRSGDGILMGWRTWVESLDDPGFAHSDCTGLPIAKGGSSRKIFYDGDLVERDGGLGRYRGSPCPDECSR